MDFKKMFGNLQDRFGLEAVFQGLVEYLEDPDSPAHPGCGHDSLALAEVAENLLRKTREMNFVHAADVAAGRARVNAGLPRGTLCKVPGEKYIPRVEYPEDEPREYEYLGRVGVPAGGPDPGQEGVHLDPNGQGYLTPFPAWQILVLCEDGQFVHVSEVPGHGGPNKKYLR